jgi:hypothetical protein
VSQGAAGPALAGLHGFARALTSFVGRASQLDDVAALLREYRLVTATGPGGVGKTRLATEVAARVADQFAPSAHTSWGTSSQVGDSHRAVLVVHYRTHRFGAIHHFQQGQPRAARTVRLGREPYSLVHD